MSSMSFIQVCTGTLLSLFTKVSTKPKHKWNREQSDTTYQYTSGFKVCSHHCAMKCIRISLQKLLTILLLDEVEQNITICQW